MDVQEKLKILSAAAKYDVSCASSGGKRKNKGDGIGNSSEHFMGICHTWTPDGRCVSLLKVLMSNNCIYDCAYCMNRCSNSIPRATFTPDELIDLTINFYRRNYIEGLFLSSGVIRTPDYTMEKLIEIARRLREEQRFYGYIHMKVIPGTDEKLVKAAGKYADRLSVNLELPSERGLTDLAPQKSKQAILKPMGQITTEIQSYLDEQRTLKHVKPFAPAGQSTQLIVGATPESDFQILSLTEQLYHRVKLRRVYYSAYVPLNSGPMLPSLRTEPPLQREHRLYQADWLLRFYKFSANEIVNEEHPLLDNQVDPKTGWALRNLQFFPVEINRAPYEALLRIPGVGVQSAQRILTARRCGRLDFASLKKMGVVLKRARYFITCNGKYLENESNGDVIRQRLLLGSKVKNRTDSYLGQQIELFDSVV